MSDEMIVTIIMIFVLIAFIFSIYIAVIEELKK